MPRKNNRLTKDFCEQAARRCTTLKEFWSRFRSEAAKSYTAGWMEEFTWLARERVKRNSLTEDACRQAAMQYPSIREFRTGNPSVYATSARKGWLSSFTWLTREMGVKTFHTKESLAEFSRRFRTLKEFREAFPNEYHYAWEHKWLNDFTWLDKTPRGRGAK
jgi:hypothetical protein